MRVEAIDLVEVHLPFRRAFGHAKAERSVSEAIVVVARSGDHTGFGEILPRSYVTGETIEQVFHDHAPRLARRALEVELDGPETLRRWLAGELDRAERALATFGGLELALWDLSGRALGFPAGAALGALGAEALPTGVVIGFEIATESLEKHCAMLRWAGRRAVKVKVGRPDDEERLARIGRVLADLPLRLDANGAWTAAEAVDRLRRFAALEPAPKIASIEQPVPAGDIAGLAQVRAESGVKVMADESLVTFLDGERLIAERAADIFSLRLGKNGGFLGTRRLAELARSHGLDVHLGTMVGESGILSRAAEIFSRWLPGADCLEGRGQNGSLLAEDLLLNPAEAQENVLDAPGLGVVPSADRIRAHTRRRVTITRGD